MDFSSQSSDEEEDTVVTVELHSVPSPGKKAYVIRLGPRATTFFLLDDRYEVESMIGMGEYGYVCSAQDNSNAEARQVAIKVLYDIFRDSLNTKRLLREVRILRQLSHPFIVRIIDIMEPMVRGTLGSLAVVLDKMESDLHHFLYKEEEEEAEKDEDEDEDEDEEEEEEESSSSCDNSSDEKNEDYRSNSSDDSNSSDENEDEDEEEAEGVEEGDRRERSLCKLILNQLLRGIQHLHSANILHRDLKPQNVLIGPNRIVKICDFGLARTERSRMTQFVVSAQYRPPELIFANDADTKCYYSPAIDMWSLGCIFAELIGHNNGNRVLFPNLRDNLDFRVFLREILSVVPKPSCDDPLDFFENEIVRSYVRCLLPDMPTASLRSVVPDAPPDAVDLLERMLVFDPRKRITAAEALEHPYMADVTVDVLAQSLQLQPSEVEVLKNGSAPIVSICDDEIENADEDGLRKLIYEECLSFRAERRD